MPMVVGNFKKRTFINPRIADSTIKIEIIE